MLINSFKHVKGCSKIVTGSTSKTVKIVQILLKVVPNFKTIKISDKILISSSKTVKSNSKTVKDSSKIVKISSDTVKK